MKKKPTKKRPPGRPASIDASRYNVTLDAETHAKALRLGDGNLSKGLREAVRRVRV